jgi:transcription antitermination factor NusG
MTWYVARTEPCQESTAAWFLRGLPVDVFFPEISRRVLHRRKLVTRKAALFPSYLFVYLPELTAAAWHRVDYAPGIVGMLCGADARPQPVAGGIMDTIREQMVGDTIPVRSHFDLDKGDAIRAVSGKYRGLEGIFESAYGDQRVAVFLRLFNRLNPVVVDRADVIAV